MNDPFEHPGLCRASGVSRLPEPLNWRVVHAALADEIAGRLPEPALCGPVLLTLDLDAEGVVMSAAAVDAPSGPESVTVCVLIDGDGHRTVAPPSTPAPAERAALAVRAARQLRFRPAERAGAPVPFPGYRMTLDVGVSPRQIL